LLAELFEELFGDPFVHIGLGPGHDIGEGQGFFFIEGEEEAVEPLEEDFSRLVFGSSIFPDAKGDSSLPAHPLPDLAGLGRIGKDDEMLMRGLGHLPLDLAAHGGIGKSADGCRAMPGDKAALVGDGFEPCGAILERDVEGGFVGIPAEFLYEQGAEVEVLKEWAAVVAVEWHGGIRQRGLEG